MNVYLADGEDFFIFVAILNVLSVKMSTERTDLTKGKIWFLICVFSYMIQCITPVHLHLFKTKFKQICMWRPHDTIESMSVNLHFPDPLIKHMYQYYNKNTPLRAVMEQSYYKIWGTCTLLEYLFIITYTSRPWQFRERYCAFYSITFSYKFKKICIVWDETTKHAA